MAVAGGWPAGRSGVAGWPWPGGRGRGRVAVAGWPAGRGRVVAGWPWPGRGRGRSGRQLKKAIVICWVWALPSRMMEIYRNWNRLRIM